MTATELLAALPQEEVGAARLGRTWPMLSLKQAVRNIPVGAGFDAFKTVMGGRLDDAELVLKPLISTREFALRAASVFREVESAGEPFTNRPSRVVGAGDHRIISHTTRSSYLAAFDNVRTRGRSQLLEFDNCVLLDFESNEFSRIDDDIELDSAIFRRQGEAAWIIEPSSSDGLEVEECFSLLGPNTFAFGPWIIEYLPRLWQALDAGLPPDVPILIDRGMSRQHRESLEMLVGRQRPIVEVAPMQCVDARRLWFSPTFYYAPIYPQFNERFRYDFVAASPERFRRIFSGMASVLLATGEPPASGRKLFLARKPGSHHRRLVNQDHIRQLASAAGFESVYLEDLDFRAQLSLVRSASFLIGPEGSAFFVAFFARPGTRVCVLNHPHTEFVTEVTALLEAVGVGCTVLTGPFSRIEEGGYLHFSDYEIDPGAFTDFITEWSGR